MRLMTAPGGACLLSSSPPAREAHCRTQTRYGVNDFNGRQTGQQHVTLVHARFLKKQKKTPPKKSLGRKNKKDAARKSLPFLIGNIALTK
jgi:hypothetical protein